MNKVISERIFDSLLEEFLEVSASTPIELDSLKKRVVDPELVLRLVDASKKAVHPGWPNVTVSASVRSGQFTRSKSHRRVPASKVANREKSTKLLHWTRTLYVLSGVAAGALLAFGSWSFVPPQLLSSIWSIDRKQDLISPVQSSKRESALNQDGRTTPDRVVVNNDTTRTVPEVLSLDQVPFAKDSEMRGSLDGMASSSTDLGTLANSPSEVVLKPVELVSLVDDQMEYMWKLRNVVAVPGVSDEEWIERASMRITGKSLSESDRASFFADSQDSRRAKWLDRATASNEFFRHWTDQFASAILPNSESSNLVVNDAGLTAFKQWIESRLRSSTPIDQITREIVVARGELVPGSADYSPQAYWWTQVAANNNHYRATDSITSNLLGQRGSCIRCHESSTVGNPEQSASETSSKDLHVKALSRRDYWNLALIVSGIEVVAAPSDLGSSGNPTSITLESDRQSVGYRREWNSLFYEHADRSLIAAQPRLPNGVTLKVPSGKEENLSGEIGRNLDQLGTWVTSTSSFDEQQVNWVWESIVGQPLQTRYQLTESDGMVERQELIETLGKQLRRSQFDLPKLVKALTLSKVFDRQVLECDPVWYITSTPQELSEYQNRQRLFASFPASMDPSFRSLENVASWFRKSHSSILGQAIPQQLKRQSSHVEGSNNKESTEVTSAQTQFIVKSRVLPPGLTKEVDRWLQSSMPWEVLVDHAFYLKDDLAATSEEQSSARDLLSSTRDRRQAIQRILASQLP